MSCDALATQKQREQRETALKRVAEMARDNDSRPRIPTRPGRLIQQASERALLYA